MKSEGLVSTLGKNPLMFCVRGGLRTYSFNYLENMDLDYEIECNPHKYSDMGSIAPLVLVEWGE